MIGYLARRVAAGVGLLFAIVTLVFVAVQTVPGDPALILLSGNGSGGSASPEAVEALRHRLGLDRPVLVQYGDYLLKLVTGDLGTSYQQQRPVTDLILGRLPNTLELVLVVAVLSVAAGVALGAAAARGGRVANAFVSFFTALGISAPVYVVGTVLVFVVAVSFHVLPAGGFTQFAEDPVRHLQLLILPTIAIALGLTSVIARTTRSAVLETIDQDWVRTARSLGLSRDRVFRGSVLRNSLTPVATVVGLEVGALLGSTVLVERVFSWPGLSTLLIDGVNNRDYPVIQGVVIVTAALFILINILVDVLYTVLDPRARLT